MVLEVGLAYAVAYFAVKRSNIDKRDAEAYGSGLAFWENVGLISILNLVNLVAYYFILSSSGSLADLTYNQLTTSAPIALRIQYGGAWDSRNRRCRADFLSHDPYSMGLPMRDGCAVPQEKAVSHSVAHGIRRFSGSLCFGFGDSVSRWWFLF